MSNQHIFDGCKILFQTVLIKKTNFFESHLKSFYAGPALPCGMLAWILFWFSISLAALAC